MSDRIENKGVDISAGPHKLADGECWKIHTNIERHTGGGVLIRPFSAADAFDTRDEAVRHCLQFGRRIIDGEEPDLTVSDMT